MNMDIKLFRHIENSDYGLSASFSLAKLEFKERSAIAVVRFCPKHETKFVCFYHLSVSLDAFNKASLFSEG